MRVCLYLGTSSTSLNNYVNAGFVTPNTSTQTFTAGLSSLAGNTTFYYQIQFYDSSNGAIFYGSAANFTTLLPAATTGSASSITASSAIVSGTVNPQGTFRPVTFYWGTSSTSLNNYVNAGYVTPNTTTQTFSAGLSEFGQ